MESGSLAAGAAGPAGPAGVDPAAPTLKKGAIGYLSNVVIGVASTAPAYSLAATLGFVVAVGGVGVHAPAVLLVSFVPILFIAAAYKYLNRADPDCGTSFSWATRALGPHVGWVAGWAIVAADVIVMATLAQIAAIYSFKLVGADTLADKTGWVIVAGVVWIVVMTYVCHRGIALSARIQQFLLAAEVLILAIFAVVALVKTYGNAPAGSMHVSASWFNPFDLSFSALVDGVLLGVFIYWGWDSGVAVNEESEGSADGPGRAAVVSTLLLLGIYLVVSAASQAYAGTGALASPDNQSDVLGFLGTKVFGSPWDKLLIIAVLTSSAASTQTTILPTARTTLSMARQRAIPAIFGRIHPRYLTPSTSTIVMGVLSAVWTIVVLGLNPSGNVLGDSIAALGFAICFYYGLTGFACAVYYRREVFRSVRNFVLVGLAPLLGGLMMFGIAIKAFAYYSKSGNNYAQPFAGIEVPIAIGIGSLLLGVVLMGVSIPKYRAFFRRRPETAEPGVLEAPLERSATHL